MADDLSQPPLNERAQAVLKTLIAQYIRDGQPVGSRTLSKMKDLALSPATIRNVMSDLEDLGYLSSPHTSAGRVPTDLGYRLFVDTLVQVQPLDEMEMEPLHDLLDTRSVGSQELIEQVSSFLSGMTQMAGLVTLPRTEATRLRHLEFLPLSDRRVLTIMVINEDEVQNRIIDTDRDYTAAELEQAGNLLNSQYSGKELSAVRRSLRIELDNARRSMNAVMETIIAMADRAIGDSAAERDVFAVAGQTNLMNFDELSNMEKLKALFEEFSRKRDIFHLLDNCVRAEGIQIFIGAESGYEVFDECSLVTAPFAGRDEVAGVLGVIGPTRMAYERVIPIVDVTSKLLSATLNSRH